MKKIILPKADALNYYRPEGIIIEISSDLPKFKQVTDKPITAKDVERRFAGIAETLVTALVDNLPQGVLEPLLIKLMERRISVYRGVMK